MRGVPLLPGARSRCVSPGCSPAPRDTTSTGRRRRGRTRARHLRCGRLSGRSRRRGEKAPGSRGRPGPSRRARAARGSPWAFKNPKGVAYCRDHHLHNKCSGSPSLSSDHRPSARVHSEGESHPHQSHSGRQTEWGRPGRPQMGGDFSRVPPALEAPPPNKKKAVPASQGTPEGRKHPFPRTHRGSGKTPQRDPEGRSRPARGVPRAGRQASSPRTDDRGIRQRSHGIPGRGSPTFPWTGVDADTSAGVFKAVPHPAVAGKDDAGALDANLHAYNPAFSEYIWAVDIRRKGGDLGQDMLGEEPYLTIWRARSHWWEVAPTGASSGGSLNRVAQRR